MKKVLSIALLACYFHSSAQQLRWRLAADGGISWKVADAHTDAGKTDTDYGGSYTDAGEAHTDHIEMSGRSLSAIVTYGIDSLQQLVWKRKLIFPMLRTLPNDTRGSLQELFEENIIDSVTADGRLLKEKPVQFTIDGCLRSVSLTNANIRVERCIYPSVDKAACLEKYVLTNTGDKPIVVQIPAQNKDRITDPAKSVYGAYIINYRTYDAGTVRLPPGEKGTFYLALSGRRATDGPTYFSADYEWEKRRKLVDGLSRTLVLHTPNDTLDRMFAFAKLRAAESIFDTKEGLMHSPGGGSYYAAIWANDEAEYVGPFFPFLGYAEGNESAKNSYRLFSNYLNPEYAPIPSSIIAEGAGTWNGAGDRGDQAMIAYGASRFALAYADTAEAQRLWPLISWCLEYLKRKQTPQGVIASTSDELEGRFPAGKINLSTNMLAYGALTSAARLARALGRAGDAENFSGQAIQLKDHIDQYFGARVQGFDTYRYYDGNTTLRSWICLPLVMGIFERKDQTIQALLSKYLWTKNGILTESGSETFWDRSTLYAFRGLFYAGATDTSLHYFNYYSSMRLLGEHVPYAVEAWPEGDQRHLSAESGLYCRVVTEGLFGIEPTGFNTFTLLPRLPKNWNSMSLEHIRAFQRDLTIKVVRAGKNERILISTEGQPVREFLWDGKTPLAVDLAALSFGQKGPEADKVQDAPSAGVRFRSSDTALENAFTWAKAMALHYKSGGGDAVGPWYESALPPRYAFCMRDVSHQCIGAEILGMHRENKNMFAKFTGHISASKDWCSYWEIDKFDRPSPSDYRSDREFWYNLDANFDLLDACWRSWLWTGDTLYLKDPAFLNFYNRSAHEYIRKWILEPDSLLIRPAYPNAPVPFNINDDFNRCRGLPSYSEGVHNLKMGVDLVAAIYRGLTSYAAILKANGEGKAAGYYLQKAKTYRERIDADWWDEGASLYHTHYTNERQFGKAEGETFLLWFDALKDSTRKRHTIEHLLSMDLGVENLSYLPLQYYRNGYCDQAHALMLRLANPSTQRREYPEVSYGLIEAVVQGLMGVDADASTRTVGTLYRSAEPTESSQSARSSQSVRSSQLTDLPVLNTTVTLTHFSNSRSVLINTGQHSFRWKARFAGYFAKAFVNDNWRKLKWETDQQGHVISYMEINVAPSEEVNIHVK
jgi:hypothetical protein